MDNNVRISETLGFPPVAGTTARTRSLAWPTGLLRELIGTLLPALFAALFVLLFIVQPARVDGTSMEPSFQNGERVLMEKLSYRFHAPARGDVVLMRLPGQSQPIVKRVIAVGGDQVAVRNGQVYLNGAPLEEPYLDGLTPGEAPSMQVPMGYLFILGDNRSHSQDSRLFGMVDSGDVVGRAAFTYWPLSRLGTVR